MRWSIRSRLLLPLGLLLAGVVLLGALSATAAAHRAEARLRSQLQGLVDSLAAGRYPLTGGVLEQVKQLSGAEFLLAGEERIATLPALLGLTLERWPGGEAERSEQIQGRDYLLQRVLLNESHRNAGATLVVCYPQDLLREAALAAMLPPLLAAGLGLLAIALTTGLAGQLVRRIRTLESRTRVIAAGDFSPMPLPGGDDELRDLAASINEMAQHLSRLHEAVRRTERVRLVGQLASGLAHQLRNGVTGARLALQVHQGEHVGESAALEVVLRQLRLMDANLRRLLNLGRDSDGHQPQPCHLPEIIQEVMGLMRPQAEHHGIRLSAELPDAPPASIPGEAALLTDLLLNLVTNALEAAGPGGAVRVVLRELPESRWRLEVRDSGPGPAKEVRQRLFEPFTTSKPEGVGLGLAVARHAALRHDAELSWTREGGETVFRVESHASTRVDA